MGFIFIVLISLMFIAILSFDKSKKTHFTNSIYTNNVFASNNLYGLYDTKNIGVGGGNSNNLIPILTQNTTIIGYNQINLRGNQNQSENITVHEVRPNETVSQIAEEYGISIETILWSNHIDSADNIGIGDILTILPINGVLHEVQLNEAMEDIVKLYSTSEERILTANDIANKNNIFPGQKIIIPGTSRGEKPAINKTEQNSADLETVDGYFIRPTRGILSQGIHGNNAIDIANSCWTPIYAASSGTVSLSVNNGKWNGGYGNFITIKHTNSTTTLYAHLIKTEAKYGEYVEQGEVIGYMGSTGFSTGCHVHFEIHGAVNNIR